MTVDVGGASTPWPPRGLRLLRRLLKRWGVSARLRPRTPQRKRQRRNTRHPWEGARWGLLNAPPHLRRNSDLSNGGWSQSALQHDPCFLKMQIMVCQYCPNCGSGITVWEERIFSFSYTKYESLVSQNFDITRF